MRPLLFFFAIIILYCACGSKSESKKRATIIQRNQLIDSISKKYNAFGHLDTLNFHTSLQFQNLLGQNKKVLIAGYGVSDIERTDSDYVVTVEYGITPKFFLRLSCSKELSEDFLNQMKVARHHRINDKYLIVRLEKIKKIKLNVDYIPGDDENESEIYISSALPFIFLGRGKILDVIAVAN